MITSVRFLRQITSFMIVLCCLISPSAWADFLIVIREVEGSVPDGEPKKVEEHEASVEKKFRRVLEVRAGNGEEFYIRSSEKNSQVLFMGTITALPEDQRRAKLDYKLHYSILGVNPPDALRIKGSMETAIGNQNDPAIFENSVSVMHPERGPTYWELEPHNFFQREGMRHYPTPPLWLRLLDEEGEPVKGASIRFFFGDDEVNMARETTLSDEDGILEMHSRYYLPLAKVIVEHEERHLVGTAHLERHLDTSRADPYVIMMKKRSQADE